MANTVFKLRRSSVAGKVPNTSTLSIGELGLNLTDKILYSSDGSSVFEIGANNTNVNVSNTITLKAISANGSVGTSGQVLKSNGSSTFWGTDNADVGAAGQILYRNSSNVLTTSSGLQYDGSAVKVNGRIESLYQAGDEGGELYLNKPATNTSIIDGVTVDIYQNKLRFFEAGGNNRGVFIDITAAANGVGTNLAPGGGTVTSVDSGSGLSGGPITSSGTLSVLANTGIIANATGVYVNSTYIGTLSANSATYLGNSSGTIANISSWITTNAAAAYTNSVSYTDGKILTANSAITGNAATAYSNAVSYTDTVVGNVNTAITSNASAAYSNAVSYVNGLRLDSVTNTSILYIPVANTVKNAYDRAIDANTRAASAQSAAISAYSNAVSYTDGKIATANSAITGNAATAYSNAIAFAANASNITSGTLPYAQIPANIINTTANFTISGVHTHNANVVLGTSGLSANSSYGTAGHVLHSNGTATYWAADDQGVTSITAGNGLSGNITTTGTISVVANNGITANSTGLFVTQGTGTVVNSTGVHVNSTYIGTLTSNNATNAFGKTEGNLNVNSSIYANASFTNTFTVGTTTYFVANGNVGIGNAAPTHTLSVNGQTFLQNDVYLGDNLTTVGLFANGSAGSPGHVLHSNGSATYWAADDQGVTSVATGSGLTGGPITSTGTISILANNGIIANTTGIYVVQGTGTVVNTTGVHVNSTYIGTLTANNANYVKANSGITSNASGVFVTQGTGTVVNTTGVHVNSTYIGTLTVNNATNLGGQPSSYYGIANNGTYVTPLVSALILAPVNIDPTQNTLGNFGGGVTASGRSFFGWNRTGGGGELDLFINRNGGSTGGLRIYDWSNTASSNNTSDTYLFHVTGAGNGGVANGFTVGSNTLTVGTSTYFVSNGNVGIGNSAPADKLVVVGNITPGVDNSYNLGSTSLRWANVYTGDLHLSNERTKGNDFDGTTGNWTIQEGETDLYIINNKNGKKFKFKLEEIQ